MNWTREEKIRIVLAEQLQREPEPEEIEELDALLSEEGYGDRVTLRQVRILAEGASQQIY